MHAEPDPLRDRSRLHGTSACFCLKPSIALGISVPDRGIFLFFQKPQDKKTVRPGAFTPVQRELVFDIDMTDYDSIRTCCSGADICKRCWGFIGAAVRVLDSAIRQQFGYEHLLWVYSGRRGIHLWVSDREAMALTDDQRRSLVNFLTVVQGGKEMHKKVNVRPIVKGGRSGELPPSIQ